MKFYTMSLNNPQSQNWIQHQKDISSESFYGATEGEVARWYGAGTPFAGIFIPTRYLHSSVECIEGKDASDALNLTEAVLYEIKDGMEYI